MDYSKADTEPQKPCDTMGQFKSKDIAEIAAATIQPSQGVPAHCRITGVLSPEIAFEVSLPAKWNGRFYMIGNGGHAGEALEDIIAALETAGTDWAADQLKVLATKSPTTMKVSLRQLQRGARCAAFAENMAMEYRIGARIVQSHDFIEGVRAVIVEKDNAPKWSPATPEGVTEAQLDGIFAPLPSDQEWSPLP